MGGGEGEGWGTGRVVLPTQVVAKGPVRRNIVSPHCCSVLLHHLQCSAVQCRAVQYREVQKHLLWTGSHEYKDVKESSYGPVHQARQGKSLKLLGCRVDEDDAMGAAVVLHHRVPAQLASSTSYSNVSAP